METRWSLKLEDKAAAAAKRIKREVVALKAAMRDLAESAGVADRALRGFGGGDTSRRLRAQTGLIREQTRAMKEQRATQAQQVRSERAAATMRSRETRQQLDAHAAVARVSARRDQAEARSRRETDRHYADFRRGERASAAQRQRESRQQLAAHAAVGRVSARRERAARQSAAAQQRADALALGGRTRMDMGRDVGAAGRTRLDMGSALGGAGGRTRQEGFSLQQQERLRRMGQQGRDREARDRQRANVRDERENGRHFGNIYRGQQQAQAWGQRRNEQAQRQNAQVARQRSRQAEHDAASPIGAILKGVGGEGLVTAVGYAAAGAAVLMGAIYALGSAMLSITQTTIELVGQLGGLVLELGQLAFTLGGAVLRMIAFREGTLMTLSTLMRVPGEAGMNPAQVRAGREQAAQGEFQWAQQFGRETPLSTQQVVELRTQASTAGYQGREARDITSAAADAGALHPNDAGTASRFMLQMGQLRNSSVARSADYRPAAQAAGVSEVAAMRRAAIAAGVVQRGGENESAYQRRIRTAQGNGSITGRQMHDAILAEQNSMLGNRQHGDFARSQSGSMAAVLSNLGEGAEAFVTSIHGIEHLPGILVLKAMLMQIADTLAGVTNNGKRLQAFFATFVNDAAGMVGGVFGPGGFDGALSQALDIAKALLPPVREVIAALTGGFMQDFGPFLAEFRQGVGGVRDVASTIRGASPQAREMGRGLAQIAIFMLRVTMLTIRWTAALITAGQLLPMLASAAGAILHPVEYARQAATDQALPPGSLRRRASDAIGLTHPTQAFHGVGADMANGVSAGFRSRQADMQAQVSAVMNSLPTQARTDMQIKSPSRVMAEIGEYMAMGVTLGLDNGAAGVQSAMSSVVAPPTLGGFGGGGMGGGAGVNVGGVTIQINGAQDASGVVDELQARVESIFVGLFERAQFAGGA